MKVKHNAKNRREEIATQRKHQFEKLRAEQTMHRTVAHKTPSVKKPHAESKEDDETLDTRLFLDCIEHMNVEISNDEPPATHSSKSHHPKFIQTANLEAGMPSVEEALQRMDDFFMEMKTNHIKLLKLIHGYGSTGRGGKIREEVRKKLNTLKDRHIIAEYLPGEDFNPFDEKSRRILEVFDESVHDPDFGQYNQGITLVVMNW